MVLLFSMLMAVAAIVKNLGLDNTVIDTEKIDDTRLDGGK